MYETITQEDELRHYGRKGMKWYQNIFTKQKSSATRNKSPSKKKLDEKEVKKKKKSPKDMTPEELREAIGHMELEARYSQLAAQTKKVGRGRRFVGDMVDKAILPAAVEAGKKLATDGLIKLGKKYLGLDEETTKDVYAEMKKEADYAFNKWKKADYEQKLKDLRSEQAADGKNDDSPSSTKKKWDDPTVETKASKKKWGNPTVETKTSEKKREDDTVETKDAFEGTVVNDSSYSSSSTWKKGRETVIDATYPTSSSNSYSPALISSGRSYISGLLGSSISGLLEEPKE